MDGTVIYVLRDPLNDNVRYVGRTTLKLTDRLSAHFRDRSKCHRTSWLKSLRSMGLTPKIEELEKCSIDESSSFEIRWIKHFRELGCNLVNGTDGGEGMLNPSAETRSKISSSLKGRPKSKEHAKRISLGKKGNPKSPAQIRQMSESRIGKPGHPHTNESRAKISERLTGRIFTMAHREKLSLAQAGKKRRPRSVSHQAKLNAALTGRTFSLEHRAHLSAARRNFISGKAALSEL